jgi:hypothetical protein
MAAGYKDWSAGNVLTAADLEDYTVKQSVMRFASAAARDSALSAVLTEGLVAYLIDTNTITVYTGSAWSTVGPVHGGGTSWTPAIVQSGSVTCTVNSATYFRQGRLVTAFFDLSVTGTGSSANVVTISLPVTCRGGISHLGNAEIVDSSASLTYRGLARTLTTSTFMIVNPASTAATSAAAFGNLTFTAALASGDTLSGQISFEAAADA